MQRISKFVVLSFAAGALSACNNLDEVVQTSTLPTAGVRFINAVPDTMAMDFRFVDFVENNAHFKIGYRNNPVTTSGVTGSTLIQYKPARAGSRTFRIFINDTSSAVASTVLNETTYNFLADNNYTVLIWGYARTGSLPAMKVTIINERVPDPTTNVAIRIMNATGAAIDAEQYTDGGAATGTNTAGWSNIAALDTSAYFSRLPGDVRVRVKAAGGANPIVSDALALLGAKASFSGDTLCGAALQPPCDIQATGGTRIAGSAVTAIVFPGSVVGSSAAQFNVATGSARQRVTTAGYEGPRSYVSDGFTVGMQVEATSFTAAQNNGLSVVTAVTNGATRSSAAKSTALPGGRFLSASATGYGRSSGSFITDGFAVGQVVTASGFLSSANNVESTITAVAATVLTTTPAAATVVEAGTTGSTTIASNSSGYSRPAGSFVTDGFMVGHSITVSGFVNSQNNGTSVISYVNPNGLDISVTKTPAPIVEAGATGREIWVSTSRTVAAFGRLDVTKTGGLVAAAAANARRVTANPTAPGVTFMWDRRPPRGCVAPYC